VRSVVVYTLARLLLFLAAWGVVWLVASIWLEWSNLTALWTALIAVALSAIASYPLLRPLRERLAAGIQARAAQARTRYGDARRREDVDE
jgi:hypothetical protein